MIDFVSVGIDGRFAEMILANPQIDFNQPVNVDTGELILDEYGAYVYSGNIGNLNVKVRKYQSKRKSKVTMTGSIHKFYLDNNYQDFSFSNLVDVIYQLTQITQIPPKEFTVHQIEFGLNIMSEIPSSLILENIISHNGLEYELKTFNRTGYLKRFERSHFDIKIYDKGRQYHLSQDIIRFELKAKKMQYLHKKDISIQTFVDLMNRAVYNDLGWLLIKAFNELIFTDDRIVSKNIECNVRRSVFNEYSNPRSWNSLRRISYSKKFNRQLKKFREIVQEYSPDNIQETMVNLIQSRWDRLSKDVPILPVSKNQIVSHYYIDVLHKTETSITKQCLTCGRDISNQKSTSKYCSEKLFGREVKRCRNRISNFKRDELNRYPSQTLFDVDQYLSEEYRRWKGVALQTII